MRSNNNKGHKVIKKIIKIIIVNKDKKVKWKYEL